VLLGFTNFHQRFIRKYIIRSEILGQAKKLLDAEKY
jgi:hypothetical protein